MKPVRRIDLVVRYWDGSSTVREGMTPMELQAVLAEIASLSNRCPMEFARED